MSSVVYQETSNDFTHNNQTINSRPIASVVYGPMPAPDSSVVPDRSGLIYVQIKEGSTDKKTHMWISVVGSPGSFIWEELFAQGDIPSTVVRTDKVNDFQPYEQKISGNQILSFVDGGTQTPEQSKLPADYDGQFYIAVRTLSGGKKDVSIWIASGNQWLPLSSGGGSIDTSRLAKLDVNNEFEALNYFKESVFLQHNTNFIGELANARQVIGCRVKNGGNSPAGDPSWRPAMEGEMCIYNNINTTPHEISIWIATNANTIGSSHWKQIYPTSGGGGGSFTPTDFIDNFNDKESNVHPGIASDGKLTLDSGLKPDDIAYINKANTFVPFQKIGGGGNEVFITGARYGYASPKGLVVPLTYGEIYCRQIIGTNDYEIWIATQEADTDSWTQVFDEVFSKYISDKLSQMDIEIENLGEGIKEISDGVAADIDVMDKKIDSEVSKITQRVIDVETTANSFEGRVADAETNITSLKSVDQSFNTRVGDLEDNKVAVDIRLDDLNTKIDNDRDGVNQVVNEAVAKLEKEDLRIDTELTEVEKDVTRMDHDITDLYIQIDKLKTRIEALESGWP